MHNPRRNQSTGNLADVYNRLNADVDYRNSLMLNNPSPESQQYTMKASDAIAGQTSHICLSNLSEKRSETGGSIHCFVRGNLIRSYGNTRITPYAHAGLVMSARYLSRIGTVPYGIGSLGSRPSPFTHAYISKRMRYPDSLCALHALINCAYVNERGRPGTEATV